MVLERAPLVCDKIRAAVVLRRPAQLIPKHQALKGAARLMMDAHTAVKPLLVVLPVVLVGLERFLNLFERKPDGTLRLKLTCQSVLIVDGHSRFRLRVKRPAALIHEPFE